MKQIHIILLVSLILLGGCSIGESRDGGVYKSSNKGEEWKQSVSIEGSDENISQAEAVKLAASHFDPSTVYLATSDRGFYSSSNFGDSWKRMLSQITTVYDIETNPFRDKVIYSSVIINGRGKIISSYDGGEAWREIHSEAAKNTHIDEIAVSPHQDRLLVASNSQGLLMRTDNDGDNWQGVYNFEEPLTDLLFDDNDSSMVWALNREGVWKSDDLGSSFVMVSENKENLERVSSFYLLGSINGSLFLSTDEGFFISKDEGENWEKIYTLNNPEEYPIKSLEAFSSNRDNFWAVGAGMTIYFTEDAGKSWKPIQLETERNVNTVLIKRDDDNQILVGVAKIEKGLIF